MSKNMDQYVGYKLAKAIYKINALIPATSADAILQAAGVPMAVTSRFQNVKDRLSKSAVRLVRLCAIPDPSYIYYRENKIPRRNVSISNKGQIALRSVDGSKTRYLSIGLSDDGVPFAEGVPPIDMNPHIGLQREERRMLLEATLKAIFKYEPDKDEIRATDFYYLDSFRPYYELLTEFLLHIPRELQDKFLFILKGSRDERGLTGKNTRRLVYIFTRALEVGRYAMFDEAQEFLSTLRPRSRSKEFVSELFDRFGIVPVEEGIKGPGRRPPITDEGRRKIIDAAMYLTVFLSEYVLRLRKTRMGEILRAFAMKYRDYFGITGELGDNFLSRVLTEARNRRFKRICLMIRPGVEGVKDDQKYTTYLLVAKLGGMYFRSIGRHDFSVSLRKLMHEYFGSTMFIFERKLVKGARVDFDMIYASAALNAAVPNDKYPPTLTHAVYLLKNDYRIASIVNPQRTEIYYTELTPERHYEIISRISEAFLPKNELYDMTKSFVEEYVRKNSLEEERSPTGTGIAGEALPL